MLTAHHNAGRARLRAHPKLANKVNDTIREDAEGNVVQANYVVLETTLPGYEEQRLTSGQAYDGDQTVEYWVRVVAVDVDGMNDLLDAVLAQMTNHRMDVQGRALTGLRRADLPAPDYDKTARVHFRDVTFEATTSRA